MLRKRKASVLGRNRRSSFLRLNAQKGNFSRLKGYCQLAVVPLANQCIG